MMSGPPSRLLRRRRFDVADLGRMTEAGVLQADERLELIEGELVEMGVPGPRHSGRVDRLARLLFERCGERSIVRVQNPLLLDAHNLYLPDLALLRPTADFYESRYPTGADALLAVEIADSSLAKERRVKLPAYARAGVGELWVLDLRGRRLFAFADPHDGGYRQRRCLDQEDELLVPVDGRLRVAELLA